MRHQYPNRHWTSEINIPQDYHGAGKGKNFLDFYTVSMHLCGSECWTTSSQMTIKQKVKKMLYRNSMNGALRKS